MVNTYAEGLLMVYSSSESGSKGTAVARRETPFQPASLSLVPGSGSVNSTNARSLNTFLTELNRKIDLLSRSFGPPSEIARGLFDVLSQVLKRETGTARIESGMGDLFHQLWGGGDGLKIFFSLYYGTRSVSGRSPTEGDDTYVERLLHQVSSFIEWYGIRRTSLAILDEELPRDKNSSAFFAHRIAPSTTSAYCGMPAAAVMSDGFVVASRGVNFSID